MRPESGPGTLTWIIDSAGPLEMQGGATQRSGFGVDAVQWRWIGITRSVQESILLCPIP